MIWICVVLVVCVSAVTRSSFKNCKTSAPCVRYSRFVDRQRRLWPESSCSTDLLKCDNTVGWSITDVIPLDRQLRLELTNHAFLRTPSPIDQKRNNKVCLTLEVFQSGFVRLTGDEAKSCSVKNFHPSPRFRLVDNNEVLMDSDLKARKLRWVQDANAETARGDVVFWSKNSTHTRFLFKSQDHHEISAIINLTPFEISYFKNGKPTFTINQERLFNFEVIRPEEIKVNETALPENQVLIDATDISSENLYTERMGKYTDIKKDGPTAIGLDISFMNAWDFFGLPEHATNFALPSSTEFGSSRSDPVLDISNIESHPDYNEPYRFWNSDVFEYTLDTPHPLYGSIPLLCSYIYDEIVTKDKHDVVRNSQTGKIERPFDFKSSLPISAVGILSVNPSETFVKLEKERTQLNKKISNVPTWWLFESGIIDMFFFWGDTLQDITQQYYVVTGLPPLPKTMDIGFHQSRWNYRNQGDVEAVNNNYDEAAMPLDYIWLDIEHTENKKYFTWHKSDFSEPQKMIDNVAASKRDMVLIVDPHIRADSNFPVHEDLIKLDGFVKNEAGTGTVGAPYQGWCWPGDSKYPDFLQKSVRDKIVAYYHPKFWSGTAMSPSASNTPNKQIGNWLAHFTHVGLWNDMNEPSVFSGPELSLPRNTRHKVNGVDVDHRSVHNLYGLYVSRTTWDGCLYRDPQKRPFLLTRAFFVGSHRYGAVWTGDNLASVEHMAISVPMILSLSLGGFSFAGADVGGFFKNPDSNLLLRWLQVGSWYPFFRVHSHIETARRELYLLPEPHKSIARECLRSRYKHLPFWYTRMARNRFFGLPVLTSLRDFELQQWKALRNSPVASPQWPSLGALKHENDAFLVGNTVLVYAIRSDVSSTQIQLPGIPSTTWYSIRDGRYVGKSGDELQLGIESANEDLWINGPILVKGGSVVPSKDRFRRSAEAQRFDPYSITIYGFDRSINDEQVVAKGSLYIDDGISLAYEGEEYLWCTVEMERKANDTYVIKIMKEGSIKSLKQKTSGLLERLTWRHENLKIKSAKFDDGREIVILENGTSLKLGIDFFALQNDTIKIDVELV